MDGVVDRAGLADVTCRTGADLDDVAALRLEREVLVERRHTVDARDADVQHLRDHRQALLAEVAARGLNVLQNSNEIRGAAAVALYDGDGFLSVGIHAFPPSKHCGSGVCA